MSAIFETDLTQRQVDVLYRIYAHYLGKPKDGSGPLYFKLVPMSEMIETWYSLITSKLIMLLDSYVSYDPFGKILFVRLTSLGNEAVEHFLRAVRKAPIERLPELLVSEFAFVAEKAKKRLLEVGDG